MNKSIKRLGNTCLEKQLSKPGHPANEAGSKVSAIVCDEEFDLVCDVKLLTVTLSDPKSVLMVRYWAWGMNCGIQQVSVAIKYSLHDALEGLFYRQGGYNISHLVRSEYRCIRDNGGYIVESTSHKIFWLRPAQVKRLRPMIGERIDTNPPEENEDGED